MDKLRQAVPGLTDEHISIMKRCPMRSFDPMIKQEPPHISASGCALHAGSLGTRVRSVGCKVASKSNRAEAIIWEHI